MEKVKYLHVFAAFNQGGAELRVANIINHTPPGSGHAVLSLSGQSKAAHKLDRTNGTQLFDGPPRTNFVQWPFAVWRRIRQINPKVLITYNWGATDAIIGAKLHRFRPVIHNECGLSNEIDGKAWRRRTVRRLVVPGCYRTVVTSASMRAVAMESFGVPESKIAYIKTGVDGERFQPQRNDELRSQISPGTNGVIFGYVGSLRPSKNIPMLLRAYAKACRPEDRLAIFGQGSERASLEALGKELGILDSMKFMGHMEDVAPAYGAFDVYVTTSKSEAASNSLLEAMATGCPAVSADIADNKLLLSKVNRQFVFSHSDLSGYAAGLRTMAEDSQLRERVGQANRHRALVEYPLDRMINEYIQLWDEAARHSV
ncbi:putative glycosyltransferase EpsD [Planctomycetes bacterium CA13]|uniref:Putative glycosyltransferase EpsD n=2 Tax=Novipirellula herctigrandis TaxID=2527986 RepID=A0A5C5Z2T0_9BACT|nr:putative glycosyltransferase EpsD [Planctomycetes bacterium CA13]